MTERNERERTIRSRWYYGAQHTYNHIGMPQLPSSIHPTSCIKRMAPPFQPIFVPPSLSSSSIPQPILSSTTLAPTAVISAAKLETACTCASPPQEQVQQQLIRDCQHKHGVEQQQEKEKTDPSKRWF
jgi:uncharacterized membrane protein YcgQ (UPF0703/DUF1980 family)